MPALCEWGAGGVVGHLHPAAPSPLPPLAGVPAEIALFSGQHPLVDLARAMVEHGLAKAGDWDPDNPAPGRLVQRAIERVAAETCRGLPETLPIYVFVRPWVGVLRDLFVEDFPDEHRWVFGLESEETHRIRTGPLVDVLGEDATAIVLTRLMQHTPLCTEGPDDLEWIIDGWYEAGREPGTEARRIRQRRKEAVELSARINGLIDRGHGLPLDRLPHPRIRRLLGMLETLSRATPKANDTAWRETEGVEWSLTRPVFQLIWDEGCALDHAVDEAEHILNQDGSMPCPQQMWILDPRDPSDAACTWSRWVHALRQVSVTTRILHALDLLADTRSPR